jgi:hypothetical protein
MRLGQEEVNDSNSSRSSSRSNSSSRTQGRSRVIQLYCLYVLASQGAERKREEESARFYACLP